VQFVSVNVTADKNSNQISNFYCLFKLRNIQPIKEELESLLRIDLAGTKT